MNKIDRCIVTLCSVFFVAGLFVLTTPALTGCKTPPSASAVAYDTLSSVGATVDASMKAAASLRASGKITAAQWQSVADIHAKYLVGYNAAIDAAAVAVDSAQVPANVAALATSIVNLVQTFTK